ncbi:MAG: methyltransferase domain-containing protein [Candidatus Lokiarchaeota archaeon]|nr:methyltransferase domain-containing protein [Candidatus Lokiarchaeota archaeon]MBD3340320.1 methyltransferase domain-containing protein [Candidatus Lokiarchaeota archaeon]
MVTVKKWKETKGEQILLEVGIDKDQLVLDFGCGKGIYSVLAAKIVGEGGKIYALDSNDEKLLHELRDAVTKQNIKNIKIIETSGEISLPFNQYTLDVVLIYDVYHLLDKKERAKLLRESHRVLKKNGILSYHATHLSSYDVKLSNVKKKLKQIGFAFINELHKPMFHWNWIEESVILNFEKMN